MKSLLKGVIGLITFVLVVYLIYDFRCYLVNGPDVEHKDVIQASGVSPDVPAPNKIVYHRSAKEQRLIRMMVQEDFEHFSQGGKSSKSISKFVSGQDPVFCTSSSLQQDYEDNEVAGDKRYRNRFLFVSGMVTSIDRGFGESYYIGLQGGQHDLLGPRAEMASGYADYLAGLKKGESVNLFCQGSGFVIGMAMLRKCIPASDWAERETEHYLADLDNKLQVGDKAAVGMSVMVGALSLCLADSSPCLNGDMKACGTEFSEIIKTKTFQNALFQSAQKHGVDAKQLNTIFAEEPWSGSPPPSSSATQPEDHF